MLSAGARVLEGLLKDVGCGRRDEPLYCGCGGKMNSVGRREKSIKTVVGKVKFDRSVYVCEWCGASRIPGDEELGVVGTSFSPGVKRLMSRAGSRGTFKEGQGDLAEYGNIFVSAKDVERTSEAVGEKVSFWEKGVREELIVKASQVAPKEKKDIPLMYVSYDGTGVPMVKRELIGRKGKQADGSARTREVKLGCVFTQTGVDKEGRPVRDENSTTFVGAIETAEEFGWRIYGEALRRGIDKAEKKVTLGDGAKWVWELAKLQFSDAIQIVDLYHARQHLYNLISLIAGADKKTKTKLEMKWRTELDEGKVKKIIEDAKSRLPKSGVRRKTALKEIRYFETNSGRMRYDEFRQEGLFVGSGVIEAGCKTVVGQRLKRSGMEWTVRGANSIISLRCAHLSDRLKEFWELQAA